MDMLRRLISCRIIIIAYNFSHFAIYVPKLIKIHWNLTKVLTETKMHSFFESQCRFYYYSANAGGVMWSLIIILSVSVSRITHKWRHQSKSGLSLKNKFSRKSWQNVGLSQFFHWRLLVYSGTISGSTAGGNGGSRLRAPLERGRRVQTAMFFLFCLITKFCHVLWLPMTLHSIHFAQYAHALPLTIIS